MAKDVVFESEKYMQRQEAKRRWIPIACFAAILLIIILIALFLRGNNGVVYTEGEDTPYPYSWSVNKKGEMTLDITKPEGYTWRTGSVDPRTLNVQHPEKQPNGVSRFVFTPQEAGRFVPVFTLVRTDDAEDTVYEWRLLMDSALVTENETQTAGPLSVISGTGSELVGKTRSAEDDAVAYTIHADADGVMTVEIVNPVQGEDTGSGFVPQQDKDEGDTVAAETRGEEDGAAPDESGEPSFKPETNVISDPAEIEAYVGMPYDEWVEQVNLESREDLIYDYNWLVTSDNENAVLPVGIFYGGEMATATFNAGSEDGAAAVLVTNNVLGLEVYATVENKGGVLSIKEYGSRSFEPVVTMAPETVPEPVEGTAEPETAPEP